MNTFGHQRHRSFAHVCCKTPAGYLNSCMMCRWWCQLGQPPMMKEVKLQCSLLYSSRPLCQDRTCSDLTLNPTACCLHMRKAWSAQAAWLCHATTSGLPHLLHITASYVELHSQSHTCQHTQEWTKPCRRPAGPLGHLAAVWHAIAAYNW